MSSTPLFTPVDPSALTDAECPICNQAFAHDHTPVIRLPCQHAYHTECINDWYAILLGRPSAHNRALIISCPLCRRTYDRRLLLGATLLTGRILSGDDVAPVIAWARRDLAMALGYDEVTVDQSMNVDLDEVFGIFVYDAFARWYARWRRVQDAGQFPAQEAGELQRVFVSGVEQVQGVLAGTVFSFELIRFRGIDLSDLFVVDEEGAAADAVLVNGQWVHEGEVVEEPRLVVVLRWFGRIPESDRFHHHWETWVQLAIWLQWRDGSGFRLGGDAGLVTAEQRLELQYPRPGEWVFDGMPIHRAYLERYLEFLADLE